MPDRTVAEVEQELNDFKRQVQVVARKYAERHGLCEVVERALGEVGLQNEWLRISVTAAQEITGIVEVDTAQWAGLNEDQQKEFIENALTHEGSRLDPNLISIARNVGVRDVGQRPRVGGLRVTAVIEGVALENTDLNWRYAINGRVLHALAAGGDGRLVESVCGRMMHANQNWLGEHNDDERTTASAMNRCQACTNRLARRG